MFFSIEISCWLRLKLCYYMESRSCFFDRRCRRFTFSISYYLLLETWNCSATFNRISQEEAIYRKTEMWLYLDEICYLYDFYSFSIMFSRCKHIVEYSHIFKLSVILWFFFGETSRFPTSSTCDWTITNN